MIQKDLKQPKSFVKYHHCFFCWERGEEKDQNHEKIFLYTQEFLFSTAKNFSFWEAKKMRIEEKTTRWRPLQRIFSTNRDW